MRLPVQGFQNSLLLGTAAQEETLISLHLFLDPVLKRLPYSREKVIFDEPGGLKTQKIQGGE